MGYDDEPVSTTTSSPSTASNPLFAAIQNKQAVLKPVSHSSNNSNNPPPPQGLAATLAKAMEARRGAIREDEADEADEDWGDDWE
jgi:hypothetical protein